MSLFALGLLLIAAAVHATWNLLLKRVEGGLAFQWLFGALSTILYLPAVLVFNWYRTPAVDGRVLLVVLGSSVMHTLYYYMLQRGYRAGDLSLVYPLARGTGPLVAMVGAILLLGERPTVQVLVGGALVILGIFVITGGTAWSVDDRRSRAAVPYGLITGFVIAGYTLWDKTAVSAMSIAPLSLDWATNTGRTLLLAPVVGRRWNEIRALWANHRREAVAVALLNPFAYILVLTALQITPVSYIAPAREVSILAGALMGAHFLGERGARTRLIGAASMVSGLVFLVSG